MSRKSVSDCFWRYLETTSRENWLVGQKPGGQDVGSFQVSFLPLAEALLSGNCSQHLSRGPMVLGLHLWLPRSEASLCTEPWYQILCLCGMQVASWYFSPCVIWTDLIQRNTHCPYINMIYTIKHKIWTYPWWTMLPSRLASSDMSV